MVFASFSVSITVIQESRSERALEALRDLSSPRALVVRDGVRKRIPGREVVRGDIVVLAEGDRVPVDAWVLNSEDLQLDESLLTGESVPVRKIGCADGAPAAPPRPGGDGLAYVFAGSLVARGAGLCRAAAAGSRSEIGRIGQSLASLEAETPRLQRQTRRVVLTFAIGDYIAPASDRTAQLLKARFQNVYSFVGNTGAWLKERQGENSYAVNVATMSRNGLLKDPRILEFGSNGFILSQVAAASAQTDDGHWTLVDVERQEYDTRGPGEPRIVTTKIPMLEWPTSLTTEMVSVALLRPERMRTLDLFEYIRHLEANGQTAQRYEIEFWRKVFYPLSCLVMVVLALPFAYLHFRQAGITTYVFGGVMIGISFFLLNNVFGYLGNLGNWWPWITAAAPGLIYSVMSLAAFSWLVLRR